MTKVEKVRLSRELHAKFCKDARKAVIECEDPRKTHWQLFLKLEMEAKKKLEDNCLKWVDDVLAKQKEYNDLRYQYEMIPSVPIVDYQTLKTFCGLVKDEVKYDEYLISCCRKV